MDYLFADDALHRIRDQAAIFDCACPAQLCKQIGDLRELHAYQLQCGRATPLDSAVHDRVATTVETAHEALEHCLRDVLRLEGWNMDTLEMPAELLKTRLNRT